MIYETIASLLNKKLKKVSVPSELFARYHKEMGDSVLGDKMHSSIFDNSKIKSVVPDFECTTPFSKGAKELVDWHLNNMEKLEIDPEIDSAFDKMIAAISKAQ